MAASAYTEAATASNIDASAQHWPLSFSLQLPKSQPNTLGSYSYPSNRAPRTVWWSHRLYRGPGGKEIEIMYSKTKAESEAIALRFLDEPVIGFDMEWPWGGSRVEDILQNKIGLIQIASEDKIGLFHIGLHPGKTSDDIIAPTLKKIIEDSSIAKVGVNILRADYSRLIQFFGLEPKGAIELSHLHRLVKFGPRKPEYVSVKLVSLAQQVEEQLGLPLYKGDVRTSDWSKPLSAAQIDYAAGDAYAGFMLYKCMNAKRLAMRPIPPPPLYAERYPSGKASRDDPIILDVGDGTTITTAEFFGIHPVKTGRASTSSKEPISRTSTNPLDETSQTLYDELLARRALLAKKADLSPTRVISDTLLRAIARERPHNTSALLAIKGVGKIQQQKYGDEWLQVISQSSTAKGIEQPETSASKEAQAPRTSDRRRVNRQGSPDLLPSIALGHPAPKVPQLHTGLSFTLAESKLDEDGTAPNDIKSDNELDEALPTLIHLTPTSRCEDLSTKRKRIDSPRKQHFSDLDPHDPHVQCSSPSSPVRIRIRTTPSAKPKGHLFNEPSISHALSISKGKDSQRPSNPISTPKKNHLHTNPSPPAPPEPESLVLAADLSARIARSKLLAFSRQVTRKLPERRSPTAPPIVTLHTLDLIVRVRPQTKEELDRIPGVDSLVSACERTGMDLLRNVIKFVGG